MLAQFLIFLYFFWRVLYPKMNLVAGILGYFDPSSTLRNPVYSAFEFELKASLVLVDGPQCLLLEIK